jgi:hypothetical protein
VSYRPADVQAHGKKPRVSGARSLDRDWQTSGEPEEACVDPSPVVPWRGIITKKGVPARALRSFSVVPIRFKAVGALRVLRAS